MGIFSFVSALVGRHDTDSTTLDFRPTAARAGWEQALARGERRELETAAANLGRAGLEDEMLQAYGVLAKRFPRRAADYENQIAAYFVRANEHARALVHSIRSYRLQQEPAAARAQQQILESTLALANVAGDPRTACQNIFTYFDVCLGACTSEESIHEIRAKFQLDSGLSSDIERTRSACAALDQLEGFLRQVSDPAFVAEATTKVAVLRVRLSRRVRQSER